MRAQRLLTNVLAAAVALVNKAAAHQANAVLLGSAEGVDGRAQAGARRSSGPALAS